ncbi:MAG: Fic family protein [Planctomycetota bacterium]|nr:Fic family protein [Planctomycetota bacterium]
MRVDPARVKAVVLGKALLKDRDEEEVRGYRDALKLIHEKGADLALSEATVKKLHALSRMNTGDAGKYKERDNDIIERYPDGTERIRFRTVPAKRVQKELSGLVELWSQGLEERWTQPALLLAAFNLDFLCIHPFRDGNGRVSRLLLLQQAYRLGFEVGRYISLERLIEAEQGTLLRNPRTQFARLARWQARPWPYLNFVLYTLKTAYKEFEERVGQTAAPKGEKTGLVLEAIAALPDPFRAGDLRARCPNVSVDMIRKILKQEQKDRRVRCLGRGARGKGKHPPPRRTRARSTPQRGLVFCLCNASPPPGPGAGDIGGVQKGAHNAPPPGKFKLMSGILRD